MLKKILVVDDDAISNKIIVTFLKEANYIVEEDSNANDAWKKLLQHPDDFSLILVDRMMFGVDGMTLLHRIKHNPQLKNIPVVMLTGEAEPEDHVAAIAEGACDFIYKPVENKLLLFVVENALKNVL